MVQFKLNPVGHSHDIPEMNSKTDSIIEEWNKTHEKTKVPWWKIWKKRPKGYLYVTIVILNALDALILKMGEFDDMSGEDKKATVMNAITKLYNKVIKEAMPIWLRPWAKPIKFLIIDVIISYAIDFIVGKYNQGLWKKDDHEAPPAPDAPAITDVKEDGGIKES